MASESDFIAYLDTLSDSTDLSNSSIINIKGKLLPSHLSQRLSSDAVDNRN